MSFRARARFKYDSVTAAPVAVPSFFGDRHFFEYLKEAGDGPRGGERELEKQFVTEMSKEAEEKTEGTRERASDEETINI